MRGSDSKASPGGDRRRAPMNDVGPARSLHCGSVRIESPSTWTSRVAWPIHVMALVGGVARSAAPSLATRGASNTRGAVRPSQVRRPMKAQRVQAEVRLKAGFRFRKPPPGTWCAGKPPTSVPALAQATITSSRTSAAIRRGTLERSLPRPSPPRIEVRPGARGLPSRCRLRPRGGARAGAVACAACSG